MTTSPALLVAPHQAEAVLPPGPIVLAGDAAWRLAPWLAARGEIAGGPALPELGDIPPMPAVGGDSLPSPAQTHTAVAVDSAADDAIGWKGA